VNGFGGFTFDGGTPSFAPHLPKEWRRLSYRVRWQGRIIEVVADHDACTVTLLAGKTLTVRVYDEDVTLTPRREKSR
jgi:trehalose/maltose hydrolase-like predicted phosphorylase